MTAMTVYGFDWDPGNFAKCERHGLTIREIEAVFRTSHHLAPDITHSEQETRFLAIGKGDGPRMIFVAFTFRQSLAGLLIRPISARYMHQKEVDHYEKTIAKTEN
jgi:uncharacterized protein